MEVILSYPEGQGFVEVGYYEEEDDYHLPIIGDNIQFDGNESPCYLVTKRTWSWGGDGLRGFDSVRLYLDRLPSADARLPSA